MTDRTKENGAEAARRGHSPAVAEALCRISGCTYLAVMDGTCWRHYPTQRST